MDGPLHVPLPSQYMLAAPVVGSVPQAIPQATSLDEADHAYVLGGVNLQYLLAFVPHAFTWLPVAPEATHFHQFAF